MPKSQPIRRRPGAVKSVQPRARTPARQFSIESGGDPRRPDLVFGLVSPLGCDLLQVIDELRTQCARFGYTAIHIKVTQLFTQLPHENWRDLPTDLAADEKYDVYMEAGDRLRQVMNLKDAAARIAVGGIRDAREKYFRDLKDETVNGLAFVIDSLKTPEEVELFRLVYESRFFAIGVHVPRRARVETIAKRITATRSQQRYDKYTDRAERLVHRDERGKEINPYGQNVGDAFPLADVIISSASPSILASGLRRFYDILFGYPYHTPTRDELGMAMAELSSMRSADMARQVGAAIVAPTGTLVSVGSNDVPRFGGGQYWSGDEPDARDFQLGEDPSDVRRRIVLANTIACLLQAGWKLPDQVDSGLTLTEGDISRLAREEAEKLWAEQRDERLSELRQRLLISDLVDFSRVVHAEMAALTDAGFRGADVRGGSLYCTTFPCHECARHIIAAGITQVFFLEPYPKSLVSEFFDDSIAVDEDTNKKVVFRTFVGVAPRRFRQMFRIGQRKDAQGRRISWHENAAAPRTDLLGIPGGDPKPTWARNLHKQTIEIEEVIEKEFDQLFDEAVEKNKEVLKEERL